MDSFQPAVGEHLNKRIKYYELSETNLDKLRYKTVVRLIRTKQFCFPSCVIVPKRDSSTQPVINPAIIRRTNPVLCIPVIHRLFMKKVKMKKNWKINLIIYSAYSFLS